MLHFGMDLKARLFLKPEIIRIESYKIIAKQFENSRS